MISRQELANGCTYTAVVGCVVLALVLFGVSFAPFGSIKGRIDAVAPDGSSDWFDSHRYATLVPAIRLAGVALFITGGLLYSVRRRVLQLILASLTRLSAFLHDLGRGIGEALGDESKVHLGALLLVLVLAIAVRVLFLSQPMHFDESFTFVSYASQSLYWTLSNYSEPNNHLFHTLLVNITYSLLGNKPWVIRLPALFAGILIVPASYILVRKLYDKYAALLTAGVVASLSVLVEYSTNARGYTLITLFFLLLVALGTYLKQNTNWAVWPLFVVLSALGFYTIPIMLYPFGIAALWLLLSIVVENTGQHRKRLLRDFSIALVAAGLLTMALYAPVFIRSGLDSVTDNRWVESQSGPDFVANWPPALGSLWEQWSRAVPSAISVTFSVGFVAALVFHRRLTRHRVPVFLAIFVWCITLVAVQRVVPPRRVWLFLLPVVVGVASAGVSYLLRPLAARLGKTAFYSALAVALSLWMSFNVVRTQSVYIENQALRDGEQIAVFLKEYLTPGDRVVVVFPADAPLEYYFTQHSLDAASYLYSDLEASDRLVVVVNEQQQTLAGVLEKQGLPGNEYSAPELIRQYQFASLYVLNRMSHTRGEISTDS